MSDLRLEELSASNISAVNGLSLKPGQEQFIAPVSYSAAAAVIDPGASWQRAVMDGDELVGFIHAHFDPEAAEEFRSCIWRINIDAAKQGRGVGTFAVRATADEARARGFATLTVIWESGEDGPEQFFRWIGFEVVAETQYGENVGALTL
ncbi:GNAT family N-acetyltransferase [Rathayibacter iranicus]|uniref:N-acetyltransferase n=2 Tax=Rathayibacter iranicus TaxID=59737 RepID=A0AAD1AFD8_9MICO|nr:GNAT family N-acetyltransferase [Rathayibacter iranicus]AZZ55970.1 N-acetyltransferase [Rathayibacter iranicus]MWV30581.1 GNAT family N-acetyltransferase [Rathayibacter iranicus NCPPB 2253 = VKM Ac-1602]PPI47124.1 GNAT family N-acetyltransferase [Rathayibacter iranicus]PPI60124.1 GNAT family N-acetyltransferase [Rathayibacter iranicus]PPI71688.1 GNAT family N-acetyltransferase [Rathayibacter iranicus]